MVHMLLKPGLENFEHYFTSMWDECNCAVVWAFFAIAFLWDWNENWPFPVLWPLWVFQICWCIECNTLTASSFRTGNSLAGIPSPPLASFVIMLPKQFVRNCLFLIVSPTHNVLSYIFYWDSDNIKLLVKFFSSVIVFFMSRICFLVIVMVSIALLIFSLCPRITVLLYLIVILYFF